MLHIMGILSLLLYCIVILFVEVSSYEPHVRDGGNSDSEGRIRNHYNIVRKNKANEVSKYMNTDADPCVDFYEFACGKWNTFHKISRNNELLTPISLLDQYVSRDLHDLLSAQMQSGDTSNTRVVNNFYRNCLSVETKTKQHRDFLLNFVKNYGGLPSFPITNWNQNYNWLHVIANLRSNYSMDILIGLEIDIDSNRKQNVYLSEPKTTLLPAELCSEIATTSMNVKDEAYAQVQREISRNMQTWLDMRESEANRFAGDIVYFEFEICKQMRKDHAIPEDESEEEEEIKNSRKNAVRGQNRLFGNRKDTPHPRHNLHYFTQQFNGVIDFKYFVDVSLKMPLNKEAYMRSVAYFQNLARAVQINSKATITNYIMYRAISELNFPSDDRPIKRRKSCVDIILKYFPKIVGQMYGTKKHRGEYRTDTEILYSEVRQAFLKNLKEGWLEVNRERGLEQKVSQFKLKFPVYEDQDLSDLQIDNMDYWEQLEEVMLFSTKQQQASIYNGYFSSNDNNIEATDTRVKLSHKEKELQIGWGLLQDPIYNFYYSNAIKYSTVGQHIARELVNIAIDDQAQLQYQEEEFDSRSECVRIQYSNYLYNDPDTYRNGSKLEELIADISGLNIAFNAYLGWLENTEPSQKTILNKETLPEINYTNTQLFFIAFAQGRCTAKKEEDQPPSEYFPLDKHSSERYEVNGPLSNSIEFAREFGCTMGSEMHPDDKCFIY